ncbi:LacI family DNA-binding transcriptional regulator [Peribacillus muralis]|uniref:LacI family DNA-binding transcriptional regulator n=1 Tax=Peribacillus muralis TaxID=264697 RepID=UPI001F4E0BE1|nr:LacI family DNA-binding transcriptional regulator [Peribacillus muralis]MCK1994347.1 LacI family DNA-binding transcriptional regulator [Peribacillus muralis]MCK2014868.1 LacI family DNA-binding transcriptional regulator [Peribacillus muralis]
MTNIKEIAQFAGVSVSTVSRVLNNHPYVSPDKRESVLQAIDRLNYSRNINAIHLSKGKTNLLGIIIPFTNHPYYGAIVHGITKQANAIGCHIVIFETHYEREKEIQALNMLQMKQLDGIIVCSRISEMKVLLNYQTYGPIILCEDTAQAELSSISIDHYAAFSCALEYVIAKGYKKIGYSLGRKKSRNSFLRAKAFNDIMKKHQLINNPEWLFEGSYHIKDGVTLFQEWNSLQNKPEAIIITNDDTAAGFILTANKCGIKVPEEVAILGFNNDNLSELLDISTISLPLEWIGKMAVELFEKPEVIKHVKLDYTLIKRKSV